MQEAVGKVATSFFDAMKSQPLALALAVMNIGLLGFLYYSGINAHNERKEEMTMLYKNREQMAELLFKCQPPDHK